MPSGEGWACFGPEGELREKGPMARSIEGKEIAVIALGDRIAAIQRKCPHQGGDLEAGEVVAARAIKCPLHGFIYDLSSGKGLNCSPFEILIYPVKVEGGEIYVQVNAEASG